MRKVLRLGVLPGLALLVCAEGAMAQTEEGAAIHWAYSAFFGTGRYKFEDGDEVSIISMTPGRRIRAAAIDARGNRTFGIALRVPSALGLYHLDLRDIEGALRFENVSTISVIPGVEFDIPISERWSLKPLAYIGWGGEIDGDSSAWIYRAGFKSGLRFERETFDWVLINGLTYMGYSSDTHRHDSILQLVTGAEFSRPLQNRKLQGQPLALNWHIAYTAYRNSIDRGVLATDLEPAKIGNEWELGVAFSSLRSPFKWRRLKASRLGVAFRLDTDGDFSGFALTFASLFER